MCSVLQWPNTLRVVAMGEEEEDWGFLWGDDSVLELDRGGGGTTL